MTRWNARCRAPASPSVADLDKLPVEAFVSEMAPLVEGAPAFLEAMAGARPLETTSACWRPP